jgi:hypothetical protein
MPRKVGTQSKSVRTPGSDASSDEDLDLMDISLEQDAREYAALASVGQTGMTVRNSLSSDDFPY